ncbi:MAG TPA: 50S ribosomal protein L13 [Candidatus Melainabacteria bacterium]|nr:50S ribosomal protein L13 [Candidatus Melainabacteria bacterium]HIN64504.1 50S ribosomal protein L13 [Candidatus Obscuribacterales bacterium]
MEKPLVKTYLAKDGDISDKWFVVDAEGKTLGRLATRVADILRGKNKPQFTPNVDTGDFVIIINAEKIKVTGKKETQKVYSRHSGFPHGFKQETLKSLRERRPTAIVERAVKGMLPHTRLGARQFTKLKVYAGTEHPHAAQQPEALTW